jgi:sodium/potassium-transporting ATPase subunit alpha
MFLCARVNSVGESEALDSTAKEAPAHMSAMDAHNIAFNSSMALDGEGYGVVIRTGDRTFIGVCIMCAWTMLVRRCRQSGQVDKRANARRIEYVD